MITCIIIINDELQWTGINWIELKIEINWMNSWLEKFLYGATLFHSIWNNIVISLNEISLFVKMSEKVEALNGKLSNWFGMIQLWLICFVQTDKILKFN